MLIPLSYFLFAPIVLIIAAIIGYSFRSKQIGKLEKKISELEKDIMSNHADILDLHRDKALLEQKLNETSSPVIPMTSKDEKKQDTLAEINLRKKLMVTQSAENQS